MKKYYIFFPRNFSNEYILYWTETKEDEEYLPEGAERISRKSAIAYARDEIERREYDTAFSGYAEPYIFPANWSDEDMLQWIREGQPCKNYIVE